MTARIKECYLRIDFAEAVKSPEGHIFIKTLRERVMEELKLDDNTSLEEF